MMYSLIYWLIYSTRPGSILQLIKFPTRIVNRWRRNLIKRYCKVSIAFAPENLPLRENIRQYTGLGIYNSKKEKHSWPRKWSFILVAFLVETVDFFLFFLIIIVFPFFLDHFLGWKRVFCFLTFLFSFINSQPRWGINELFSLKSRPCYMDMELTQ